VLINPYSPEKEVLPTIGPGAYEDRNKFGDNVQTFTIGTKSVQQIEEKPGPGSYEPSETMTKTRVQNVLINPSPERREKTPENVNIGPGAYDEGRKFGDATQTFSIG